MAPGADGVWLVKDRVFGFLCWRLQGYFPVDLPMPLEADKGSFAAKEAKTLEAYLKGADQHAV
jgi:hypothetical protein